KPVSVHALRADICWLRVEEALQIVIDQLVGCHHHADALQPSEIEDQRYQVDSLRIRNPILARESSHGFGITQLGEIPLSLPLVLPLKRTPFLDFHHITKRVNYSSSLHSV